MSNGLLGRLVEQTLDQGGGGALPAGTSPGRPPATYSLVAWQVSAVQEAVTAVMESVPTL